MCFSPQASFSAAFVLAMIGHVTLRQAQDKSLVPLASVPAFFSMQQFAEGILWLHLRDHVSMGWLTSVAPYIFIFFALIFWPTWIPFSLWVAEENKIRKWIIAGLFAVGLVLVSYYLRTLPYLDYQIMIKGNSLQYYANISNFKWTYATIILGSCFISSIRGVWAFGMLIIISFLIADYFYQETFVSVWCFLSAINSCIIFTILKQQKKSSNYSPPKM